MDSEQSGSEQQTTNNEIASTTESSTNSSSASSSTESTYTPWQAGDWQPAVDPDTLKCGETVAQTRTYTDLNKCDVEGGKPAEETQEIKGALCSAPPNATGTCQADGTCSFTCNDGYQKDESGVCQ